MEAIALLLFLFSSNMRVYVVVALFSFFFLIA